jgi:hypothetical protein
MKDNKTMEIVFLKNESRTMIIFVSESQSQNILGKSLPNSELKQVTFLTTRTARVTSEDWVKGCDW